MTIDIHNDYFVIAILLVLLVYWVYSRFFGKLKSISPTEAIAMIEENKNNPDFILLDVRTKKEFEEFSIPNAVNIPLDELPGKLDKLSLDKQYLIYCHSGVRSSKAFTMLSKYDFKKLDNLRGGIVGYARAGGTIKNS